MFQFGPEQTEISVDGKELVHGKGAGGPLIALRPSPLPAAPEAPVLSPFQGAGAVDDLQLTRFAEPSASFAGSRAR